VDDTLTLASLLHIVELSYQIEVSFLTLLVEDSLLLQSLKEHNTSLGLLAVLPDLLQHLHS